MNVYHKFMEKLNSILDAPIQIILVGAIITILGGFITAFGTYLQNIKSSKKTTRIETGVNEGLSVGRATGVNVEHLKKQNVNLLNKVDGQEKTIDNLRKENTDLYSKLREATNTLFNHIKGGLDPTYLHISYHDNLSPRVTVLNKNEFSVYGARIDIIDYDSVRQCNGGFVKNRVYIVDEDCLKRCLKTTQIAELIVGETIIDHTALGMGKIATAKYGRYQIAIRSRYTFYVQQLVFKRINGNVYTTSRILQVSIKPVVNVTDIREIKTVEVIGSGVEGFSVDFDKVFPTGLIDFSQDLSHS